MIYEQMMFWLFSFMVIVESAFLTLDFLESLLILAMKIYLVLSAIAPTIMAPGTI